MLVLFYLYYINNITSVRLIFTKAIADGHLPVFD